MGVDGVSDFNALHSRKHDHEVQFCAFDTPALDGDDLRKLPLTMRKANLDRLLARDWKPSLSIRSSAARSGRTCFALPAKWDWKVW